MNTAALNHTAPNDTTLREQVLGHIRNAILDGQFKAGEKLIERELCLITGASRSILREALVHLEVNGLIERQSYRGFSVTRLTPKKVTEIFELREILEVRAAELFTERANDAEILALGGAMEALEKCHADFDLSSMRKAKEDYYQILFTACRNIEIERALSNVIDRIYYLRSHLIKDKNRRKESLVEMKNLTSALMTQDAIAANAASMAHLLSSKKAALKLLQTLHSASQPKGSANA